MLQILIEYDNVVNLPKEDASMDNVDEYIELLYEERMEDKVRVCCLEETFIVGKNRKFDLHFG
jgi:hypothetical protein